jgi:hypothetical protein
MIGRSNEIMESKAKLFGHPIHPILIVFPLGLLATSLIFDIIYLLGGNGYWSEIAFCDDRGWHHRRTSSGDLRFN